MRYILTYDLKDDKLRGRLSKLLEQYGERVQFSVFELEIPDYKLIELKNKLEKKFTKFKEQVSIFLYPVCEGCKKKIERIGIKELILEKDVLLF